MKTFTIALLGVTAYFTRALAVPFKPENSLQGREVFTPEWEVEVTPGGETVVLNGTIEEVHTQLLKLNPTWDADFPDNDLDKRQTDFSDWSDGSAALQKRTDFSNSQYNCFGRWGFVDREHIQRGINYLSRVTGRPRNGAGPGNCGRVSCSYNSAIYWCNDSDTTKTLWRFSSIADGAQYIMQMCQDRQSRPVKSLTGGQAFHKTNWNVIVRTDKC
ncbi:hypothetical protein F5X68DRAFT_258737 [Plectosphaerella plurivora]|uniref:Uncharacterized protein n=1 Tax=Plectosphaerella plurivora TaxID=936078 RepID=A0A9P8VJM6_9PEZI|nr:hypothetical protein F5X68DRAFT_258737 [Plectosphaerella plurivora]